MEAKAIVMGLIGFLLLYGGLAWCIGIAWYHSRNPDKVCADTSGVSDDYGGE